MEYKKKTALSSIYKRLVAGRTKGGMGMKRGKVFVVGMLLGLFFMGNGVGKSEGSSGSQRGKSEGSHLDIGQGRLTDPNQSFQRGTRLTHSSPLRFATGGMRQLSSELLISPPLRCGENQEFEQMPFGHCSTAAFCLRIADNKSMW
jgi:hypothetical protein